MRFRNVLAVVVIGLLVLGSVSIALAEVKLPSVIGEDMVLQQGRPVPIWGWAEPGEEVTVAIAGQSLSTKAGDDGRWRVTLAKLAVGDPLEMTVTGSSGTTLTLKNILVGEVWIASGQSNMQMSVAGSNNAAEEIAAANHPNIRLFTVPRVTAEEPQTNCGGNWSGCSPKTVPNFSAVAYYFGRHLHKELGVPIGLINTSWGGTPSESWASRASLEAKPSLKPLLDRWDQSAANDENQRKSPHRPANLYNAMIAPLIPYAMRGAIWYQGESNVGRAYQYRTIFPTMIANWRAEWGQGEFPFGLVQLAPFRYGGQDPANCAELWEAQLLTVKHAPNIGMAVTTDIGNIRDIHPKNKQDVGLRLGLWALATNYGKDLVYSGPIYNWMTIEGDQIRLTFDHVGSGLTSRDGQPLSHFTIAGADEKFHPATAEIDGNTIVVRSDQVSNPVAVRFAWTDTALPNLMNKEGLPASPFRTDQFKSLTEGK